MNKRLLVLLLTLMPVCALAVIVDKELHKRIAGEMGAAVHHAIRRPRRLGFGEVASLEDNKFSCSHVGICNNQTTITIVLRLADGSTQSSANRFPNIQGMSWYPDANLVIVRQLTQRINGHIDRLSQAGGVAGVLVAEKPEGGEIPVVGGVVAVGNGEAMEIAGVGGVAAVEDAEEVKE